jgi:hypothetical protein
MIIRNRDLKRGDYAARLKGVYLQNCRFWFASKKSKGLGYYLNGYADRSNIDAGGNTIRYD